MEVVYYIIFLFIGLVIGFLISYIFLSNRYGNKEKIDKCYNEREQNKRENIGLKHTNKEQEEEIKKLNEKLDSSYREIAEKNKYLSEDKVIIERLGEIKQLSNQIGEILLDYDKETIKHLLNEYKKGSFDNENNNENNENNNKKW